jgi:Peptidase family C25
VIGFVINVAALLSVAPRPATFGPLPAPGREDRALVLARGLDDESTIVLSAALAASNHPGIVLLDTPATRPHIQRFVESFRPTQIVPVGEWDCSQSDLEARFGQPVAEPYRSIASFLTHLFPTAEDLVVCPAKPRSLLLRSAHLAALLKAPLVVSHGQEGERTALLRCLHDWRSRDIIAIGSAVELCRDLPGVRVRALANEAEVETAALGALGASGPVRALVVTNPYDVRFGHAPLSALAPWLAARRRAALVLTEHDGGSIAHLVEQVTDHPECRRADSVVLLGDLGAIPMEKRPNPLPGKDVETEMEPLTPTGGEPFRFAVGRLFHRDAGFVLLQLARSRLFAEGAGPRKALVASNPGGGLELLETFSRNSARELANRGWQTTARFRNDVRPDELRRLLPDQGFFLWEGHHDTLIKNWGFAGWDEPLKPSFVFLQSCLALAEDKAGLVLERGAVAVVGSSTRMYSGSGGAFALAYLDALLYEGKSAGEALRHAKNFLLAYTLLKEKRLGEAAKLSGANLRSAWAFSLWGDPALPFPSTRGPEDGLPAVRNRVAVRKTAQGSEYEVVLSRPAEGYDRLTVGKYEARFQPNARLAGLLQPGEDASRRLVPFLFAEVELSAAPDGRKPELTSRLPEKNWVFLWDAGRKAGYLLVTPRPKDEGELRFRIKWAD